MTNKASLVAVALLIVGCGGGTSKDDLAGTWTGKLGMTYAKMQDDAAGANEQSVFLAEQEGQGKALELELKPDGTAVFTANTPISGTWSLEGEQVKLVLPERGSTEGGVGFGGTYLLNVDGDELSGNDPNLEGVTVTFTK